jgi:drug/metabolite transporter (DMT)-like permease
MEWFTFQIIAALVGAGNSVLDKKLATHPHTDSFLNAASFGVVGLPVAVIGLILLPPIPWPDALRGLVGGTLFILAARLYYKVMEREQATNVAVMMRLTSVETLIFSALFLGEVLTGTQIVKFTVMLSGALLLTLRPNSKGLAFHKGLWLVTVLTTLLAFNSVLLAPLYRCHSLWAGIVWEKTGCVLGTLLVVAMHRDKAVLWHRAGKGGGWIWVALIAGQSVRLITGLLGDVAIVQGVPLALTSAVGGVRLSLTLLAATFILKERWERRVLPLRIAGISCQLIGLWLMMVRSN